jgi:dihydropteroate synthase
VVESALECGFSIVNDIRGFECDQLCSLVAKYDVAAVVMHMQGRPESMQKDPQYNSILSDISTFFSQRVDKLEGFGVKDIILDVGIGFGKTLHHNLELIKNLEHFLKFERELLIGASRKSMIDKIVSSSPDQRLPATLAIHLKAIENGASIVRVHDVKEHYQAIKIFEAIRDI